MKPSFKILLSLGIPDIHSEAAFGDPGSTPTVEISGVPSMQCCICEIRKVEKSDTQYFNIYDRIDFILKIRLHCVSHRISSCEIANS